VTAPPVTAPPVTALELRDIHAAAPAPFWPPAPGWWLLAALLAAVLVYGVVALVRRYRRRRQRRCLLAGLQQLADDWPDDSGRFTAAVSALLRRVALMHYPRREVAALSGDAWLRFLDDSGGRGAFVNGPGKVLGSAPYVRDPEPPARQALLALARDWIVRNSGGRS
jgi:hypothetical protein